MTKYPKRWTKCSKWSEPSLGEKWSVDWHKWSILLKETKDMFIRHGPEDLKEPETGGPREARRNIGGCTLLIPEKILSPRLPRLQKKSSPWKAGHNTNDCYQLKKQIEEAVASGKLAHLVKDIADTTSGNGYQDRTVEERVQGLWKGGGTMGQREEANIQDMGSNQERPDQYVMIEATLTTNYKHLLAGIVRENMEVFAWTRSERTAVPRFVMEHKLKIYPLSEPVVHKRRPVAPEGRLALKEKVFRWLGEGLIRKDMYPLLGGMVKSLHLYWDILTKGFLQHPKKHTTKIRMADEDEEEKQGFLWTEGVYCFTTCRKELKETSCTFKSTPYVRPEQEWRQQKDLAGRTKLKKLSEGSKGNQASYQHWPSQKKEKI
ncbi:hypothetical protein Tco_0033491 [Tanacetum coccineum]